MDEALTERRSGQECKGLGFIFDEFKRTFPCNTCDGGVWGRDSENVIMGDASRLSLEEYGALMRAVIKINQRQSIDAGHGISQ